MVERRFTATGRALAGAEQGVKAVTCLQGDAVWKAGDAGVWSWGLLEAALAKSPSLNVGDVRDNCRRFTPPPNRPTYLRGPHAFVVEYRDGLRATALILNGHTDDTTFACHTRDGTRPLATLFELPAPPGAGFLQALTEKIEDFLATGKPASPVERTVLTGAALDVALESRVQKGKRLEVPELAVAYQAPKESGFLRGHYNGGE